MQPGHFNTTLPDFLSIDNDQSTIMTGTDITEQLYAARGSQGFGIGSYVARQVGVFDESNPHPDQERTYLFNVKYKNKKNYFKMRNLFNAKQAPAFTMPDRESQNSVSAYTALTSLPMFSKYANMKSTKETLYERLMIKMKDQNDVQGVKDLLKSIRQSISSDRDSAIKIYNYLDSMESLG